MFEKKNGKRFLASAMALVMLLSLAPVGALAADEETPNPEETPAVTLPAVEGSTPAVVETPSEETPTTQPAQDPKPVVVDPVESSSEAVILPEGDLLDQAFGVNPDAANSNGIAEYKGGSSSQRAVTSIDAEFWLTNRHASVDGVWTTTINTNTVSANGTAVTDLAPAERRATADEIYDTVFWQARVLSQWNRQTTNADDDKTSSGTEIVSIRYNDGLEYQAKNSSSWTEFSSGDQLVFYYLIRTDYTEMVQIDVSDWTVKKEPTNIKDRHSVTYQVIVDGGKDNGKVLDSEKFWYNKGFTVSSVRVRQTESDNYTISKVELEPIALGTVAMENGEYQFSLNLTEANLDQATVKIYVKPNVVPHELNYVLNGGTIDADSAYTAEGEVYPDAPVVTPTVSKKDYTFEDWYTDAAFTNKWTGTTMPNADLTLYAKWTATNPDPKPEPKPDPTPTTDVMVTANYYINLGGKDASNPYGGGTFTEGIEIEKAINETVFNSKKRTDIASNNGYIFNIDGVETVDANLLKSEPTAEQVNDILPEQYKSTMSIGGDMGREVVWYHVSSCHDGYHVDGYIKNVEITITYNPAGGKFADGTTDNKTEQGLSGQTHTIIADIPTKSGYVFAGWKVEGDSSNKIYKNGDSITPMSDLTLVAQWDVDNWKDADKDSTSTEEDSKTGGDGIPDSQQILIEYKAYKEGNGTVTRDVEVITVKGTERTAIKGSTATAKSGYVFVTWVKGEVTDADVDDYATEISANKNCEPKPEELEKNNTYVYTAIFLEDKVGEKDKDGNDTGDGIPDAWQYKVTFKVKNGSWDDGTTTDIVKYVTKKDATDKASATGMATLKKEDVPVVGNKPNEGYVAGKWDTEPTNQTITNNDRVFTYTYEAPAKPNTISYTINRHLMNKDGDEVALEDKLLTSGSSNENTLLNSLITSDMKNAQKYDEKNYVYVDSKTTYTVDKTTKELTDESKLTGVTTIDLYYYLDVIGGKDGEGNPIDKGDEIPDCYQVTIIYKSSDEGRGKISDANLKKEVLTIYENDKEGKWASEGTVTARGSVAEATGSRCYFSNWTNDDNQQIATSATLGEQTIENAKGGETYTFTANFGKRSSSGGNSRPSDPIVDIPDDDVPTGLNGADHYAYIIGYGNNDVRPQQSITRAEVATIFFRLLTDETREANMTKNQNYSDVKDSDWYCRAVATLSSMGIIKGYNDGTFQPNAPITRAEFAAIAARFDPEGDTTPASFSDVGNHWAKDEISIAANHGWINGYEDGTFKPDRNITRAEAVTLINRVLNRLPETKEDLHEDMKTWVDNMDETAWYYLAIQEATNSHYNTNKEGTKYETWTDLRESRDWSELEK